MTIYHTSEQNRTLGSKPIETSVSMMSLQYNFNLKDIKDSAKEAPKTLNTSSTPARGQNNSDYMFASKILGIDSGFYQLK